MHLAFSYHLHYLSEKSSLHLRGEIATVPISLIKWKSQGILLTTAARPNTTAGQYFYLVINFGSWHKLLLYRSETNAGSWTHFSFKILWTLQVNCSSNLTIFVKWGNIFSFIHIFHSLILNKHSLCYSRNHSNKHQNTLSGISSLPHSSSNPLFMKRD